MRSNMTMKQFHSNAAFVAFKNVGWSFVQAVRRLSKRGLNLACKQSDHLRWAETRSGRAQGERPAWPAPGWGEWTSGQADKRQFMHKRVKCNSLDELMHPGTATCAAAFVAIALVGAIRHENGGAQVGLRQPSACRLARS